MIEKMPSENSPKENEQEHISRQMGDFDEPLFTSEFTEEELREEEAEMEKSSTDTAPKKEEALTEEIPSETVTGEEAIFSNEEKREYAQLNPEERKNYISEHAPSLDPEDFKTPDGRMVDFSTAQSIEELIDMVRNERVIENGVGQHVPADTVVNLIYDRVLNRNNPERDWTKITLRHRLRETVYRLAEDYMKQDEFKGLSGLNLAETHSLEDLTESIRAHEHLLDAEGKPVNGPTMAHYIEIGRYDLIPIPLRYKVNSLLKETHAKTPRWKQILSKATSWFRR